jgi:hypothetical protein
VLIKSIKTKHKGTSIFKIEFSKEGSYVLTLAGNCQEEQASMDKGAFMMANNNYSSLGMNTNNTTNNTFGLSAHHSLEYISI